MKTSFLILTALLFQAATASLRAAQDFYADYTGKNPSPVLQPLPDELDPVQQAWQTRFADACALMMTREEKTQIEARKILYSLLDERPDSKEVLDLLAFVLRADFSDPAVHKEVSENLVRLAEKHTSSIPLNMFVLGRARFQDFSALLLKNMLTLYTKDPQTIAKIPRGMEHVRELIAAAGVFSVEQHRPELAALMYRCHKAYPWFKNETIRNLRVPLYVFHALIRSDNFHIARRKLEILSIYHELRNRYLNLIRKAGLDSLEPDEDKTLFFQLCAELIPSPHSAFIADLEKSLKEQPGNIAKSELLLFFYLLNQRKEDASALLQTRLKNATTKEKGMILLNYSFLCEMKHWDELLAFSEEYFKFLPEKIAAKLRLDMLNMFWDSNDPLRAAAVLKHQKDFQSLSARIRLLMIARQFDEAYSLLKEQALPRYAAGERAANPRQEDMFIQFAAELADMYKDFATAEKLYLIWLKKHPEDPAVLNNLAYIYAGQNTKLDEASRMISAALKAAPGEAAYLDTMAWILYRQKKYREAAAVIEKAIAAFGKDSPENVEILEHAGYIYAVLGDKVRARKYWLRALIVLKGEKFKTKIKQIQEKLDQWKEKTEK